MSKRKSPEESATNLKVGTIKQELDGNNWIVRETLNGTRRWNRYNDVNEIKTFDYNTLIKNIKCKLKKLGELNISSKEIGVGEIFYWTMKTSPGIYEIYQFCDSLIAIHINQDFKGQTYKLTDHTVDSDMGMFSFNDSARLIKYQNKKNPSGFGYYFPYFDGKLLSRKNSSGYIYESDFDDKIKKNNKNNKTNNNIDPIAIFVDNQYGDGSFPIYKGKNSFWIMGNHTKELIISLIN
ncbi:hypothetical protein QLL95_gp0701 [Cotonvirus japonicus]|uniref:Uncharacterized protein n=1 Tax=Cotonvirus japonicus TaxID=2811091 RepID=A0ABM7NTC1_9VIRU|nr:hypothetical protein QLL95_gp0701 [Cotonvirus japonicus]BCS83422.1 hypothetical protein [Cotonvirus japonicus]